jgi:hypothetical protein
LENKTEYEVTNYISYFLNKTYFKLKWNIYSLNTRKFTI